MRKDYSGPGLLLYCRSGNEPVGHANSNPQVAATTMIGMSSYMVVESSPDTGDQKSWNQIEPYQAPQPREPEASEATSRVTADGGQKDTLFQTGVKACHHARSDPNPPLRWIWWLCRVMAGVWSKEGSTQPDNLTGMMEETDQ